MVEDIVLEAGTGLTARIQELDSQTASPEA